MKEIIANAQEVDEKYVTTMMLMLYCKENGKYYRTVDEFKEDLKYWYDGTVGQTPDVLWVTEARKLELYADSILEDACEHLHENAFDSCDVEELQKLLDEYAKKQTGTTTYFPYYKQYVRVDWEKGIESDENEIITLNTNTIDALKYVQEYIVEIENDDKLELAYITKSIYEYIQEIIDRQEAEMREFETEEDD